ncbi:MAG: glutamate-1-semialdehyde 2,1-aminomutase [Planctomycetota bacterium]|nr:glutamate-1-semialdehyde 2,1-aminomutase [Planctomycetota bacterium]MDA1140589.1 glutamate-1-semialdehyde 2,1-aminomutase [Planctomycetota bacterium]
MTSDKSAAAFQEAQKYIPGGVNSPVRAFSAVGASPRFIRSGKGSRVTDIDGNEYVDYVCSWGPLILGHARASVVAAVKGALETGSSFGAPTERETDLARKIVEAVPSIEKVRLVNSGTEAAMSAIRLARGFTGRDKIIKFEGCYHGHADGLLVAAGSGATTLGVPTSPGVPADYAKNTIVLPFNDVNRVKEVCDAEGSDIAAIILEPIAGNMGVVPPVAGFLEGLREITKVHGIVLIFDEVITGFRIGRGGAQEHYGVTPDLTLLGKVIGGGLPVGAYGGKAEIMAHISPEGPVYQAGTLSGNPLAVAAGIAMLDELSKPGVYEQLESLGAILAAGLEESARQVDIPTFHTRVGSMQCMFFSSSKIWNYQSATASNTKRYAAWFRGMLDRGSYFAPAQYEAAFVSTAHSAWDIEQTLAASIDVMKSL